MIMVDPQETTNDLQPGQMVSGKGILSRSSIFLMGMASALAFEPVGTTPP